MTKKVKPQTDETSSDIKRDIKRQQDQQNDYKLESTTSQLRTQAEICGVYTFYTFFKCFLYLSC